MSLFASPKSLWHVLRVGPGLIQLLGVRGAIPCQGDLSLACCQPPGHAGGQWSETVWGELPPAWLGHLGQSAAPRGSEGSWWSTLQRAGHASSSGERNKPESLGGSNSGQLPVCRENTH